MSTQISFPIETFLSLKYLSFLTNDDDILNSCIAAAAREISNQIYNVCPHFSIFLCGWNFCSANVPNFVTHKLDKSRLKVSFSTLTNKSVIKSINFHCLLPCYCLVFNSMSFSKNECFHWWINGLKCVWIEKSRYKFMHWSFFWKVDTTKLDNWLDTMGKLFCQKQYTKEWVFLGWKSSANILIASISWEIATTMAQRIDSFVWRCQPTHDDVISVWFKNTTFFWMLTTCFT